MSEPTQSDAGAPAPEPIAPTPEPPPPPASDAPITAREAADLIAAKPAADESAEKADAAPERPSGETEERDPRDESIAPPRSWTKADKEAFALLPRDTQDRILALDRTRELELRRGQNEAAAQRQAAEALAQQAEQAQYLARQQYEQALPQKALLMDAQYRQEFGTPTWDEIQNWADQDPPKYVRWQAAYQRATAVAGELREAQAQQARQQQQEWQSFAQNAEAWKAEQTRLFHEKAPEWKDPATYQPKVAEVLEYMEDVGYPREEVENFANNFVPINIHDHRFQLIVRDALKYRQATQAVKQPAKRSVPPVQRPGSAPSRGEAGETRLRDLNQRLDRTGSIRDGAALIAALNSRR